MAYDRTSVAITKSQEEIRKLIMAHKGFGVAFVSEHDPQGEMPPQEGFHAKVMIENKPYSVRIVATLKKSRDMDKEARRVWRVLYYHMKSVFEAADSGVMEFRELMLPYILMPNGTTISENILPQLDAKLAGNPERLLSAGNAH
jgi:hypothetical protein